MDKEKLKLKSQRFLRILFTNNELFINVNDVNSDWVLFKYNKNLKLKRRWLS